MAHIDFAAHLKDRGGVFDRLRNVRDCQRVCGDIFACRAIAACRRRNEIPIYVPNGQRQAIDFWLSGICQRRIRPDIEVFFDTSVKFGDVIVIEGVAKA